MKIHSLYHHCAIVGFCAAVAITPLSLSAQTTTNNEQSSAANAPSAATTSSDRNSYGQDGRNYSWFGLLGLLGLSGLLGRNRNELHDTATRTDAKY